MKIKLVKKSESKQPVLQLEIGSLPVYLATNGVCIGGRAEQLVPIREELQHLLGSRVQLLGMHAQTRMLSDENALLVPSSELAQRGLRMIVEAVAPRLTVRGRSGIQSNKQLGYATVIACSGDELDFIFGEADEDQFVDATAVLTFQPENLSSIEPGEWICFAK